MRKVVSNTTPLIALADIGHLDLLQRYKKSVSRKATCRRSRSYDPGG